MDERQLAINRGADSWNAVRRLWRRLDPLLPGALAAIAQDASTITIEMLQSAQQIAGVSFTP
jgi:hypothetical protein